MKKMLALVLCVLLCGCALAANAQNAVLIPGGEKVEIDLDGDGGMESVTFKLEGTDGEEYLAMYLFGADGSFYEYPMYVYFLEEAWAADLDGDGLMELIAECDFYSDDYVTFCFHYTEEDGLSVVPFTALDRFDGSDAYQDGGYGKVINVNGTALSLCGSQDIVGTWMCRREFMLNDGKFDLQEGLFEMVTTEEDWEYRPLTLKRELEVTMQDGSSRVFPAGEKFLPVSSDRESVLTLTTRDGAVCSVSIRRDTESGWGWYVNGIHENDLLEFVPYAD